MRKVAPGQQWQPPSADQHNAWTAAAEDYQRRRMLGSTMPQRNGLTLPPGVIRIRNDTATACVTGDILALHDVVIDASAFDVSGVQVLEWMANLLWSGTRPSTTTPTPTYAHIGRFAVLVEPLAAGAIGLAVADGLTVAQIDVNYADHPYADIATDTYRLTSNWYGSAEIIYKEEVGATWWGVVRMGQFNSPTYMGIVEETGGIAASGNGDVDIVFKGADTNETITAYRWMEAANTVAEDAECLVRFFRDEQKWYIVEQEC